MSETNNEPAVLFTAFEPSGDDHAAVVVAELRARHPELPIYAWGGPRMARAGATVVAETGRDAVVGLPGLGKIREHRRINKQIAAWLDEHPEVKLHVPVDSPAANFPICAIAKRAGRQVAHLVAPQLWAWGPWRLRKLRRCTDLVLCLLPFEEPWFRSRGVPATFVGHPLFDEVVDEAELARAVGELPGGGDRPDARAAPEGVASRVAVFPGSRPAEIRRNFPLLLRVFRALRERHPEVVGVVGARTEEVRDTLYQHANQLGGWPEALEIETGQTDAVARWADLALVVSGTVMLQVARHGTPMVVVYKVRGLERLVFRVVGRRLITARYLTLPNLIAQQEIVPEFVPHFGGPESLIEAAETLVASGLRRRAQQLNLRWVCDLFAGTSAANQAADAIERLLGIAPGAEEGDADGVAGRIDAQRSA